MKLLLTIGSKESTVKQTVMDTDYIAGIEVVGLVVSHAHDSYEMFVRDAAASQQTAKVRGPFFLLCDRVAKEYDNTIDILPFRSVQKKRRKLNED